MSEYNPVKVIDNVTATVDRKTGLWYERKDTPNVLTGSVGFIKSNSDEYGGSLKFHLNKEEWDTGKEGLVYTDVQFEEDVKKALQDNGFEYYNEVGYSEAGMQCDDYVDFDISIHLQNEAIEKGYIE